MSDAVQEFGHFVQKICSKLFRKLLERDESASSHDAHRNLLLRFFLLCGTACLGLFLGLVLLERDDALGEKGEDGVDGRVLA